LSQKQQISKGRARGIDGGNGASHGPSDPHSNDGDGLKKGMGHAFTYNGRRLEGSSAAGSARPRQLRQRMVLSAAA
jgi:hypothetical protein